VATQTRSMELLEVDETDRQLQGACNNR